MQSPGGRVRALLLRWEGEGGRPDEAISDVGPESGTAAILTSPGIDKSARRTFSGKTPPAWFLPSPASWTQPIADR